jgi:alkyl sulfatase BDS1-like metallo-beta-lactamase superfamily hydrolase
VANPEAIQHRKRLELKFYPVGDDAWCLVGNGLSNQTFVRGPQGIIAIDSGESVEEMDAALQFLRAVTAEPIVACIYSHFHYVNGTQAILNEGGLGHLAIYGHEGIAANLSRFGGEIAPRSGRGLVQQFGTMLADEGSDALLHCGLGLFYRNPSHAPFTAGYLPANVTFANSMQTTIAGLDVLMLHAPSDATDSITIFFPELGLCVNNLVWPALFNIFAIRGEEYRDPRILLSGLDEIVDFEPQHLIGAHGPPLSDPDLGSSVLNYRDSIQFLWDQTVRQANKGATLAEATHAINLPERFQEQALTKEFYGVAEHHIRQIHNGLFGWFDEDESHLFPLNTVDRNDRLIAGFGGRSNVEAKIAEAIEKDDLRWALELATWLVRSGSTTQADRDTLASCLRNIAQQTSAANIRNWCLTRALELEGTINLDRHRTHRFGFAQVLAAPARSIATLRVLLDPDRAIGIEDEIAWHFADGNRCGLKIRGQVAVPTDGSQANLILTMSPETWASILSGRLLFWSAVSEGVVSIGGAEGRVREFFAAFELPSFTPP